MQLADHVQGEAALAAQHLVDAIGAADGGNQVPDCQTLLIHAEFDGLHWIWRSDGFVFRFIGLHQEKQNFEMIALRRAGLRLVVECGGQLSQGAPVIVISTDGMDIHASSTVAASILSYSACVPTNLM